MSLSRPAAEARSAAPGSGDPSPAHPTTAARRRRLGGISLTSRLAATMLAVGSVSLVVATVIGLNAGEGLGRQLVNDSLVLQRSAAVNDVAAQVRYYERLAEQLASGPTAREAIDGFSSAFAQLSATPAAETRAQQQALLEDYRERYLALLRAQGESVESGDLVPDGPAPVYLQATYSLTQGPIADPMDVDDADDGSQWSAVHAVVHPTYRNAVRQAGLRDVYLIDAPSERVLYTASKGPDLGTSLAVDRYSGSVVARASDAAVAADSAVVTDIDFYSAAPGAPIGAAAAPISDGDQVVGTMVLTYDAEIYTQQLDDLYEATAGEGTAGDLYLVGADGTTRSDPQSYSADPPGFTSASVAAGLLTPAGQSEIERNGTTVLVQPEAQSTAKAAADGDTDIEVGMSMTGTRVVTTVARVPVDDVEWYAVSELGVVAADSTLDTFRQILLVGTAVFVVALAFAAVAWARQIMYPVRVISDRLGRTALARATGSSVEPLRIPDRSPVELHRLAESFTSMEVKLSHQQDDLRQARAERLEVLESLLPAAVAQRISRGDIESLDEVPSATVVVVVVLGLGSLVGSDAEQDHRLLLDELHASLDDIAIDNGLDRIKVVGDSYFGSCGHDQPYLDHAPRTVAFAEQVARTVLAMAHRSATPLGTAIGINTGPVTVGMSAGGRLVYDVWGPTVTTAHDLARSARAGEIVVTDTTRVRLPADIELARWRSGAAAQPSDSGEQPSGPWVVVEGRADPGPMQPGVTP